MKWKNFLSAILALCLMLELFSFGVLATGDIPTNDTMDAASANVENGKIYYGESTYWLSDGKLFKNAKPSDLCESKVYKLALMDEAVYAVLEDDETWVLIDGSLRGAGNSNISLMQSGASSNEQIIFNFAISTLGVNTAAACGILSNIYAESSFNPHSSCIDTNGLTSYGICQWNGGRFTALKNYCSEHGLDYTTLDSQLQYLQYELNGSEKSAFNKVKGVDNTAEGAYTAGYNWAQYFERCASKYYEGRAARARDVYWAKYGDDTVVLLDAYGWRYPMDGWYSTWGKESWAGNCTTWSSPRDNGGGRNYHVALDINSKSSSDVYACGPGTVAATGKNGANGNFVIIEHYVSGRSAYSFYAHLSSISVSTGVSVTNKSKIGVVGHTGSASGGVTHVHFSIVDKLDINGSYVGYATAFSGDKTTYNGVTFYNPNYVIKNGKLPETDSPIDIGVRASTTARTASDFPSGRTEFNQGDAIYINGVVNSGGPLALELYVTPPGGSESRVDTASGIDTWFWLGSGSGGYELAQSGTYMFRIHAISGGNTRDYSANIIVSGHGDNPEKYTLDVDGWLDGVERGDLSNYGTFDITIGDTTYTNLNDYSQSWPEGTAFRISNIRAAGIHDYLGVYTGELEGTINSDKNIKLKFCTNTPGGEIPSVASNNNFYARIHCNNGLYLTEQIDHNVTALPFNSDASQTWHFELQDNNWYKITSANSGLSLYCPPESGWVDGINLITDVYNDTFTDQKWALHIVDGSIQIGSLAGAFVIDAGYPVGENYCNAYMLHEDNNPNQLFALETDVGATAHPRATGSEISSIGSNNFYAYIHAVNGLYVCEQEDSNVTAFTTDTYSCLLWHFELQDSNLYKISSTVTGKVLTVRDWSIGYGPDIGTTNYSGSAKQLWALHIIGDQVQISSRGWMGVIDAGAPIYDGNGNLREKYLNVYLGQEDTNFNENQLFTLEKIYTLTYDKNGGSGTMASKTVTNGSSLTLPSCAFTAPTGKQFKAWKIGSTEYAAGASYKVTGNTTVTAVWESITAGNKMQVSIESKTAPAGGTVDVAINIANNPGVAMTQFQISYDSALVLESVEAGSVFNAAEMTPSAVESNPYTVMFINTKANQTGNGTLAILHYRIAKTAALNSVHTLTISGIASDVNENSVSVAFSEGSITVGLGMLGDVNSDGQVNGLDVLRLGKFLTGWPVTVDAAVADVNGDGAVNGLDQLRLAKYCTGWNVTLGK